MHTSAMQNGKRFIEKYLAEDMLLEILDVGSCDVNGSLKELFVRPGWNYSGLDWQGDPEENVDHHLMEDGSFPFEDGSFDVIVSSSSLEHDQAFWLTFSEMLRVSRDQGLIYLNVPSKGPYHPFPQDFWRFQLDAFEALSSSFPQAELLESYITPEGQWHDNVGIFRVNHQVPPGGEIYDKGFFETIHQGSSESAEVILPLLFDRIQPGSVIDVGCGTGAWLSAARSLGAREVMGLDGAGTEDQFILEKNVFLPVDLARPLPVEGPYELAISLEVAEHLPACRARGYVADLVRLSDVVLFSAAVPRQGGVSHVNEQWPEYWASLFREHGYLALDLVRPFVWGDEKVEWWYQQNTLVFCRESRMSALFPGVEPADSSKLRRIHEQAYSRALERISRLEASGSRPGGIRNPPISRERHLNEGKPGTQGSLNNMKKGGRQPGPGIKPEPEADDSEINGFSSFQVEEAQALTAGIRRRMEIERERKKELLRSESAMSRMKRNLQAERERNEAILNSTSWKVTCPLRMVKDAWLGLFGERRH